MFKVQKSELHWLKKQYPKLTFINGKPSVIKGILEFDMVYKKSHFIIKPKGQDLKDKNRIKDSYEIEIILENIPPSILPQVKETKDRIKQTKEKYKRELLADVHMNKNESLCLCSWNEESKVLPNGFNLKDFVERLLVPFFYAQSYYEKTNEWLWGERAHGSLGLLETYSNNRADGNNISLINKTLLSLKTLQDFKTIKEALQRKEKIKGHWRCFCGKSNSFRKCHSLAFQGLWNLKQDIRNNNTDIGRYF